MEYLNLQPSDLLTLLKRSANALQMVLFDVLIGYWEATELFKKTSKHSFNLTDVKLNAHV